VPISKPKIVGRELDYILEGGNPRFAFVAAKKVVDAGLRRHDEAGIAGESIIRTPGITS
jgi:hypothetical protein